MYYSKLYTSKMESNKKVINWGAKFTFAAIVLVICFVLFIIAAIIFAIMIPIFDKNIKINNYIQVILFIMWSHRFFQYVSAGVTAVAVIGAFIYK